MYLYNLIGGALFYIYARALRVASRDSLDTRASRDSLDSRDIRGGKFVLTWTSLITTSFSG